MISICWLGYGLWLVLVVANLPSSWCADDDREEKEEEDAIEEEYAIRGKNAKFTSG